MLDYLEDNIRRVIAEIRPQMLEKVIENWTSRLDYTRASRGSHMPEIIFKMKQGLHRNVGASRFNEPDGRQGCVLTRTVESNQGGRFDSNESVADSFPSGAVGFKSWSAKILGAFFPLTSARKNLQSGSELAARGHPSVAPILSDKYQPFCRLPKWEAKTRHGVIFVPALIKILEKDLKQQPVYQDNPKNALLDLSLEIELVIPFSPNQELQDSKEYRSPSLSGLGSVLSKINGPFSVVC
ncbi:hypothetical protein TNCV_2482011 [Trichonephila clavipes]|nr:hypothetical protein TNCV_2482011 [Trichonephila clavipes]